MDQQWDVIAIDTGGTFTDIIAINQQKIKVFKVPSTPQDPSLAVIKGLASVKSSFEILHGTTIATNAVLQRRGAKIALITTKGFKDIIEIGRQNREDIYALYPTRPVPLVPENLRFEVSERVIADGSTLIDLNEDELKQLKTEIESKNPEVIAICLLFSFLDPSHENIIKNAFKLDYPISVSNFVLPEYREYERMSTTVMDAYVKPIISNYLQKLENIFKKSAKSKIFAVMKSDMGLGMAKSLSALPVDTVFSGLAGGIKAAEYTAQLTKYTNIISLDIGGTSTDVAAIINGKGSLQQSQKLDGLPVARPAVDVVTIGAGGGSLVQYISGLIRLGPKSAGADPGPIAYDKGGKIPTTTDVDLVFGILPEELAGGAIKMDRELSLSAMNSFADQLEMTLIDAIKGIRTIFQENIAGAIRSVSTQRGYDPRKFALLCFGGAGPVHAAELANIMKISVVIIPPYPGTWSAMGLIGADYKYQVSTGLISQWKEIQFDTIKEKFNKLKEEVFEIAKSDGLDLMNAFIEKICSMRFIGQSFDLSIPFTTLSETRKSFIEAHRLNYGFAVESEPVEVVALRVNLTVPHFSPVLPTISDTGILKQTGAREVMGIGVVPIFDRTTITSQSKLLGPAIIEQDDSTIWIPPGWKLDVDKYGFIYLKKN